MENLNFESAVEKIHGYLNRDSLRAYFVISDRASEYENFKKIFSESFEQIYISNLCAGDFFIDTDLLIEKLNSLEQNAICFGLGEYIYFTNHKDILKKLYDRSFNRKVIFICRGISSELENLALEDRKFRANNLCQIQGTEKISVVKYSIEIETDAKNFSELLKLAESGKDLITVKADLPLVNVTEIETFYDAVKSRDPNFNAQSKALDENQWREYFMNDNCEGYPVDHWRSFAAGFKQQISNPYLKFVFDRSESFESYRKNLIFALLDADPKNFDEFYSLRKHLIKNLKSPHLFEYLEHLKNLPTDFVKYLTDNTIEERRMMIQSIQGKEKIPEIFMQNYPAMRDYLLDFDLGDSQITNYFRRYKKIKLCNSNDENFKQIVQDLSTQRIYTRFETLQAILDRADRDSKLYWLDALGIEFLSYIESRAKSLGIFATIKIARANLPTLTSQNKDFYENWTGKKFPKNQQLDDLKHSVQDSIYIDEEFQIIDKVIEEIRDSLIKNQTDTVILTSDHGASRLAVIYGNENKITMNSTGEHGGRCCLVNEIDTKPDCAIEENGWWILTNYDRFSGGRLSSVEIHGGATLEEVLIPVIEFSLHESTEKISADEKISKPAEEDDSFEFFN
ncbi:MAG: BREX-4 system phosphatase PglZ [Selenomonadaceae bacterium]|nr:BREX-4 system phosphatase PglZ [Selenomonadaceae bacterium]